LQVQFLAYLFMVWCTCTVGHTCANLTYRHRVHVLTHTYIRTQTHPNIYSSIPTQIKSQALDARDRDRERDRDIDKDRDKKKEKHRKRTRQRKRKRQRQRKRKKLSKRWSQKREPTDAQNIIVRAYTYQIVVVRSTLHCNVFRAVLSRDKFDRKLWRSTMY